ncbi:hypothetical protein Xbed_02856 [Xenorhabdus beddingii]|uniref:Uncharacterized protein n=1 Tax=Xenorhabdus beddingii TaxID=40578 RepID=A0A1Y2SJD7_9GAMM|nr:hypothetical protein Xbed_02856 [Xenorhabdus beddingii]
MKTYVQGLDGFNYGFIQFKKHMLLKHETTRYALRNPQKIDRHSVV